MFDLPLKLMGAAADAAAVSALIVLGGRPIVWAASFAGVVVGISMMWRRWKQPFDRTLAMAVCIVAVGTGVFGYSLADKPQPSSDTSKTVAQANLPSSMPSSTATLEEVPLAQTSSSTPSSITPSETKASRIELYYTGSDTLHYVVEPNKLDLETGDTPSFGSDSVDLIVRTASVDTANRSQVSPVTPGGDGDPSYETCESVPDDRWIFSLSIEQLGQSKHYCVRTSTEKLGFFVVGQFETYNRELISGVELRWVVWKKST